MRALLWRIIRGVMSMNCKEATKSYEAWLATHTRLIEADLQLKHQQMSADVFSFM